MSAEDIRAAADRIAAAGESKPRLARDPVNLPMIRNWLEAIGADGGRECQDTAPPAMIQVWTMPGLHGARADDDPLAAMTTLLDEAGYNSVVATNCDQAYHRYVRIGERLSVSARLVDVTGPKRTALGEGWFVTTRSTWTSAGEPVASMDFRVLKYSAAPGGNPLRPSGAPSGAATGVMRPVTSPDTEFFWAGAAAGELRVQHCDGCGALRHPPGPMCPSCGAMTAGYVAAAGTGEVYSYVVHHHPPVPGKKLPVVIALVELTEGVRMTGELLGVRPDEVRIGLPVRVEFVRIDDDLTLPAWRATSSVALPPLVIDVTPTFVVSTALATRDFQDVHHDRDRAVAGGAKDIFLNILTTTGLVQRYVAARAGPDAVFRAISVRLGVPCHAGDTLTLTGEMSADDGAERVISVVGRCGPGGQVRGDHVTATVRLAPTGGRR
ncbi:MAG: OB-fold domain-containing protein [Trebonia sp.]